MSGGRAKSCLCLAATLLGLALTGPALAQSAAAQPRSRPTWIEKIPGLLRLDAQQDILFRGYAAVMAENRKPQPPTPSAEQFLALTMPQRIDFMADHVAVDLAKLRGQSLALHRFDDALSPEQRTAFDDSTRPPPGRLGVAVDPIAEPQREVPDYSLPSHTNADWLIKPDGDDISRVCPSQAERNGLSGLVSMKCTVDEDGYLKDCVVESETPAGAGFGNAALEMSAYMRMSPATNYGVPNRSEVTMPINFKPED